MDPSCLTVAYIPALKLVRGCYPSPPRDITAALYAAYMKHHDVSVAPGRYDGATAFYPREGGHVMTVTVSGIDGEPRNVAYRVPFQPLPGA